MDINKCRVIFWDLGGQAKLRSIWRNYYSEAHGVLFVLDSADHQRFEEVKRTLTQILSHPELSGIPVLICANKQDLHNAKNMVEISEIVNINQIMESIKAARTATSITTGKASISALQTNFSADTIIDNIHEVNNVSMNVGAGTGDEQDSTADEMNGEAAELLLKEKDEESSIDSADNASIASHSKPLAERKIKIQPISAMTLTGVDEGVRWLVNNAITLKNSRTLPKPGTILGSS